MLNLYLEIVYEARRSALDDYSGAEFHVLLWDEDNADNRAIREGLRQRGITVHLMSDILPSYRADDLNEEYRIHVRDAHPNARANKLIARYAVGEILNARGSKADVNADAPALRGRCSPMLQRGQHGCARRPGADPARGMSMAASVSRGAWRMHRALPSARPPRPRDFGAVMLIRPRPETAAATTVLRERRQSPSARPEPQS